MRAMLEREKVARGLDESLIDRVAQDEAPSLSHSAEDDEDELLELATLDLSDPDWISKLSAKQIAKFHSVLASGALDNVLHAWIPWWLNDRLTPSITLLSNPDQEDTQEDEEDETPTDTPAPSPPIMANIPSLDSLTKIKPSPLLINNLLEILYVYAYVKRLFNGDWEEENATEATEAIIQLCAVLRENIVFRDLKDACRTPLEASLSSHEFFVSPTYSTSILNDLLKLVSHQADFIKAALSELQDLFLAASASPQFAPTNSSSTSSKLSGPSTKSLKSVATVSQMQKKLVFMIAWANEVSQDVISAAKLGVAAVISEFAELAPKESIKETNDQTLTSPVVISDLKEKRVPKRPIIEEL
jgi:hypothetical protein